MIELLALLHPDIEEFLLGEAEGSGKQDGGELLNPGIVFLDRVVEEPPGGGNLVLEVGELALQLLEVLVGFEVGIGLASARRAAGARPVSAFSAAACAAAGPVGAAIAALRALTTASSVPRS